MTPFRFLCRFAALATLALAATAIAQAPTPAPAQARVPAGPRPGTAERSVLLDRVVAVKKLKEEHSQRFEQEARAIAALNHQHVCQLYDVGPDYLVMEYIEGQALQ